MRGLIDEGKVTVALREFDQAMARLLRMGVSAGHLCERVRLAQEDLEKFAGVTASQQIEPGENR